MTFRSPVFWSLCGSGVLALGIGATFLIGPGRDLLTQGAQGAQGSGTPLFDQQGKPTKKLTAQEWQKLFPFESVAERLEYETKRKKSETKPKLSAEAVKSLEQLEQTYGTSGLWGGALRVESLKKLHSNEVEKFIAREGFGRERMPSPSPYFLSLPTPPPYPFTQVSYSESMVEGEPKVALPKKGNQPTGELRLPPEELLSALHGQGRLSFLNPSSFGYIKDRKNIAGFQSHQFRHAPQIEQPAKPGKKAEKEEERWALHRLELVSLLKHDKPAVYVSDELPRMDNLKKAPTRPLTDFEEQALKRLQAGDDLMAEATTNRILMMGSLRAQKQCLDCHTAQRGELLGTFSYELLRDPPRPVAQQ
jgi:hypothetical protein